ncbi:hypothetical protein GUA87_10560 [Sneathiella sp. P13V-1]|uniref:type II secretion system F family protein n=1 Tax=Sneathiella sp. P13V-1 TaxID=2697366 RepID=UPI00187BB407|nr:type II secretion system F family protein [Sneathiella sp. P13V-1]MBE7637287.1 hypothetical protein [Sneathiella sp. P13V-1]
MTKYLILCASLTIFWLGGYILFRLYKERKRHECIRLASLLKVQDIKNSSEPQTTESEIGVREKLFQYLMSRRVVWALCGFGASLLIVWRTFPHLFIPWLGLALIWATVTMTVLVLRWRKSRELSKMTEQFPETLDLIVRAAKVGVTPDAVLREIGGNIPDPLCRVFEEIEGLRFAGMPMEVACQKVHFNYPLKELLYLQAVLSIQRKVGGSYAKLVEVLAQNMRERQQKEKRVNVATSEARTAAKVVGLLALGSIVSLFFLNRDQFLFLIQDASGHSILLYSALSIASGFFIIRQMLRAVS